MKTNMPYPREFTIPVQQEHIRSIKDPYLSEEDGLDVTIIHALVKIRDFPNGEISDKINPRYHEKVNMGGKVPTAITESLEERPDLFHLLNRGCLIIADRAWYNNQTRMLHFIIGSEEENGMVDGATTDRVLNELKKRVSTGKFSELREDEIPDHFKQAFLHLEIIHGRVSQEMRIKLADARNTSSQVKEWSLADLGGKFDWLKKVLDQSEIGNKIRYRENDIQPVDVRIVLALLTLFHPRWIEMNKDPISAYTGKGAILDLYNDEEANEGYLKLAPVVIDILKLYEFIHAEFKARYQKVYGTNGSGGKLGRRKEIRYIDDDKKAKILPLTGQVTKYVLPDGWLYPLLGSFRMLLTWPKSGKASVKWATDPFDFFITKGHELVEPLVETSKELAHNPNATGKSKQLWVALRDKVENLLLKERISRLESE